MSTIDPRLFDAMAAYLADNTSPQDEFAPQIDSDLDLVRRCYDVALKHKDASASSSDVAKKVVFEVLNWYPANVREGIANYLLRCQQ